MLINDKTKQKFYDNELEFVNDVMIILSKDVKNLEIDSRFNDKLLIDMLTVKQWVTKITSNYTNVNDVIKAIDDYWKKKLNTIERIYDCRLVYKSYRKHAFNEYDFSVCDEKIRTIKNILNQYKIDTFLPLINYHEEKILKMIDNNISPYVIVSLSCPVRLLVIYIDKIYNVLLEYKYSNSNYKVTSNYLDDQKDADKINKSSK